jgi:hypothetical protein
MADPVACMRNPSGTLPRLIITKVTVLGQAPSCA